MNAYISIINIDLWNIFEKINYINQIDTFLSTKSMEIGDILLFYVGGKQKIYEKGIYGYGVVITNQYIPNNKFDYCNKVVYCF